MPQGKKVIYRDSGNGQFVTQAVAAKKPNMTQKEQVDIYATPRSQKKIEGRSSVNGEFITSAKVKAHPKTTETQHINKNKPKKSK